MATIRKHARGIVPVALSLATLLLVGGCSSDTDSAWGQLPDVQSDSEDAAATLDQLFSKSDLVVKGMIADVEIRERGVEFPAVGPGDTPIYSQDVVLVLQPDGTGSDRAQAVEVRIEHLYDNSEGGKSLKADDLNFGKESYIFPLRSDGRQNIKGAPTDGFVCTQNDQTCGIRLTSGGLVTTPREGRPAAALANYLPGADKIKSPSQLKQAARNAKVDLRGFDD